MSWTRDRCVPSLASCRKLNPLIRRRRGCRHSFMKEQQMRNSRRNKERNHRHPTCRSSTYRRATSSSHQRATMSGALLRIKCTESSARSRQVLADHRAARDVHSIDGRQRFQPQLHPGFAMIEVLSAVGIRRAQDGPALAPSCSASQEAGRAVVNVDFASGDDFLARIGRHLGALLGRVAGPSDSIRFSFAARLAGDRKPCPWFLGCLEFS